MNIKKHDGLKLVPWESWHQWNLVREAVFSSSPARVSAALSKIAAWRARGSLPIAVEVTGDLISIHMKDPFFSNLSSQGNSITDEMLRLMYATAIMRLVNGVVDLSKKLNSASVAVRAKAAGLPRVLVDIRHEVAHKEIPSTAYLQLASKQALDWLKLQYWEAQKQVLDDARKNLRDKLYEHAALIDESQLSQSENLPGLKSTIQKCSEKELARLVSAAVPEVVSILQDEGLLQKCTSGRGVWRYIVGKLCSRIPELQKEIISWCIEEKTGDLSRIEFIDHLVGLAHKRKLSRYAVLLANLREPMANIASECKANDIGITVVFKRIANAASHEIIESCNADSDMELDFERMEASLSEATSQMQRLCKCNSTVLGSSGFENPDLSGLNVDLMPQLENDSKHNKIPLVKAAWSVPNNWRSCAIGMLPSVWHSAGTLPPFTNAFVHPERHMISCDTQLQDRTEQQVPVEGHGAVPGVEVKSPEVDIARTKQKRDFSENRTETIAKRIKPEIALSGPTEQSINSQMSVPSAEGDFDGDDLVTSEAKQNSSQLSGLLLLNGLYQRCGSEQITALQSEIHIFE